MGNCCPPATNVEEDNNKGGNDDTVKTKMLGNESGQKTEEMMGLLVNSSDGEERCALDFPRMHFYGVFRSNTGTGNNMIGNYKLAMEYESGKGEHEITSSAGNKGGGYLYNGDMTYNWTNCKITAAYDKDGEEDTKTYQHFEINPSSKQVSGRLNDLDTWQMMISRIFGFQVNICDTKNNNKCLLSCDLEPCSFRDIWGSAYPEGAVALKEKSSGDQLMRSRFTSILTNCSFGDDYHDDTIDSENKENKENDEMDSLANYKVLQMLRDHSRQNGNKLQINFILDGYNSTKKYLETYSYGRVFGYIGCYTNGNPTRSYKYGRYLYKPNTYQSKGKPTGFLHSLVGGFTGQFCVMKTTPIRKNNNRQTMLVVDVSNCLPASVTAPKTIYDNDFSPKNCDVGELIIYQTNENGQDIEIGVIEADDYKDMEQYKIKCGIFCIPLPEKMKVSDKYPLSMKFGQNGDEIAAVNKKRQDNVNPKQPLAPLVTSICELEYGFHASAEDLPFRLGTYGKYEPEYFGKDHEWQCYASIYGTPFNSRTNGRDFVLSSRKAVVWQGPKKTLPDWVSKELTRKMTFKILNGDTVENGMIDLYIKAPDSLENNETHELPRAQWYLDSIVWNFALQIRKANKDDASYSRSIDNIKTSNDSFVNTMIIGHDNYQEIMLANKEAANDNNDDETESKSSKSDDKTIKSLEFFVGSALVFDELPPENLPSVPLWQPRMITDISHEEWMKFLNSDDFKVKHTPYVHAIFRRYANLYPIMSNIVNLDSYSDVTSKIDSMIRSFNQPFTSPYYMPVTRDLSGMNQAIVKEWLRNPVYCDSFVDPLEKRGGYFGLIKTVAVLKKYLQHAIELELSTLPPYLSALYSMDPTNNENGRIIQLITTIVHQEMQHFSLACNLLLSIGGRPKIAYKNVAKRTQFPRKGLTKETDNVPAVLPDLTLELSPMSVEGGNASVNTFLQIEAPCKFIIDDRISQLDEITNLITKTFWKRGHKRAESNDNHDNNDDDDNSNNPNQWNIIFSHSGGGDNDKDDEKYDKKEADEDDNNENDGLMQFLKQVIVADTKGGKDGIGAFYQLIRKGFVYLSNSKVLGEDKLFRNYSSKNDCIFEGQIGPSMINGCNYVYDLNSALTAIETIVSEGEGTSLTDIWSNGVNQSDLSHFHKFLEIKIGYPIIEVKRFDTIFPKLGKKHSIFRYIFSNDKKSAIRFDKNGVVTGKNNDAWNWLKYDPNGNNNTSTHENAKDIRVVTFNKTYAKLLLALQQLVDAKECKGMKRKEKLSFGQVESMRQKQVSKAIGLMRQLQIDYTECLRSEIMPGFGVGTPNPHSPPNYPPIAPNWVPPQNMLY